MNGSIDWFRPGRFAIAEVAQEFSGLILAR